MASEPQKGGNAAVTLRERYVILPGTPLPDLATPNAQAFAAEDRREPGKPVFALIVRPGFPARTNAMRALKGAECVGLMALLEWGVVDWPPASRKVMAVIYERPLGGRVAASMVSDMRRLDEADAVRKVINPVFAALKELRNHSITHRAIRPTNMFWATPEMDRVILGDCCTAPPALEQPAAVETIETAMAHPAGRGEGMPPDDVYAFGASLAMMLRGRNAVAELDDAGIIRRKIAIGSFAALVGDERLPLAMTEILRGTLCDDPQERWQNESIDLWLGGRRLQPLLAKVEKRAARAFPFNNNEYYTARELAAAFADNWDAASSQIMDGRLELWMRRSLDQKEKADAVAGIVAAATMPGADRRAIDGMVARICMLLDAAAPIRYKGLAVMPGGLGPLLALTMIEGGDLRLVLEVLTREVPKAWLELREAYNPDNSMLEANYRSQKAHLERAAIGYGVERVLYELNDSMPCISPFTVDDYVTDIRDLLPALNATQKKGEGKAWPIDRHVAAFIGTRSNFEVDRYLADLSLPDPARSTLAMLNLLAVIQWRVGQGGLFALAGWVGGMMQPAIASFHSRERRRHIEKSVPQVVREGSLVDLARMLDNPEERVQDNYDFEQARIQWANAAIEIRQINAGQLTNRDEVQRIGRQVAALISVTLSLITVTLLLLKRLF